MAQQPRALDPAGSPEQLYGAQLRARRTACGYSQDALARRVTFTAAVIGKWEKGQSLPEAGTAALLDQLLGDDGVLLATWRYANSHRTVRDRELQPWHLMDAITRTHISAETLEMMGRAVLAAAARYPTTPPDVLLPVVTEHMQRLNDAVGQTGSARTLRRIVQLTAVCAALAGNLYNDIGDQARARDYFEVGRRAGDEAEDPGLTAWVLTTESIGPLHSRRPRDAAALADRAVQLVAATGNPRREAWVSAMAARAHAAAGQRGQALDALEHSRERLGDAAEPTGMDFFDTPRLEGIVGTVHLHLGDTEEAASALAAGIAHRAPSDAKGRALLTFDLAECALRGGEPEHAARIAHLGLDTAAGQYVRPVVDRARDLHAQLGQSPALAAAAGYGERLREIAPARAQSKDAP